MRKVDNTHSNIRTYSFQALFSSTELSYETQSFHAFFPDLVLKQP